MAITDRLAFLHANMLESTQSCDDYVIKAFLRLRIDATSIQSTSLVGAGMRAWARIPFEAIFTDILRFDKS